MANEVLIDGWLGSDPEDYPATEEKERFCLFNIAEHAPRDKKPPTWISINGFGSVADKIMDGFEIRKGDKVRITGFLISNLAQARCGHRHRFMVVVARDCELLKGSADRPEMQWDDEPGPPLFRDDNEFPF